MTKIVPVFDGHNDTILRLELAARAGEPCDFAAGSDGLHIDLPKARAGGFAGGLFALFTPSRMEWDDQTFDPADPTKFAPIAQDRALAFTLALFARLHRLGRDHPEDLVLCTDAAQARAALLAGRMAMVPHIEGAECIDRDFHALEVLYAAGLRSLGPVWSRPNAFGFGVPMLRQPQLDAGQGLTDAGCDLVRACERLGILVDLSHITEAGFWDVAKIATNPLVATHSNAHRLSPSTRNLTDRQLAAVAESGGLVGLNFSVTFLRDDCARRTDTPLSQLIRHLDHLIGILGEDGVALGSDFDGCTVPADITDATGLARLVTAMRQASYGEALIAKICHENWLAMLERVGRS